MVLFVTKQAGRELITKKPGLVCSRLIVSFIDKKSFRCHIPVDHWMSHFFCLAYRECRSSVSSVVSQDCLWLSSNILFNLSIIVSPWLLPILAISSEVIKLSVFKLLIKPCKSLSVMVQLSLCICVLDSPLLLCLWRENNELRLCVCGMLSANSLFCYIIEFK